jgi:hypothetical protein
MIKSKDHRAKRKRRAAKPGRRRGTKVIKFLEKDTMIGKIASGKIRQDILSVLCKIRL